MEKLPGALKPGGRVAILTFHSGEDRLVKQALKEGYREGIYFDYAKDVIRPSAQECAQNGRARSTKMRWAVRECRACILLFMAMVQMIMEEKRHRTAGDDEGFSQTPRNGDDYGRKNRRAAGK